MRRLRNSENIWTLGLFLGATGVLSAVILGTVSLWTAGPIAEAKMRTQMQALRKLNLPEFDNDAASDSCTIDGITYMAAKKAGKIVGYAARGSGSGYAGPVTALVGFDPSGKILAVQILEHKETPGLGAAVCERKFQKTVFNLFRPVPSGLPPNPILDQFNGRSGKNGQLWKVAKDGGDFVFRSGATVSSRAVVSLVGRIAGGFDAAAAQLKGSAK